MTDILSMSSYPMTAPKPSAPRLGDAGMPTPRILIVDDDPEIVYLIKEVLNLLHSEVLVRNDGDSALKLLHQEMEQHQSVDVVLLDIMMPGEDGFHILGKMKADTELQQIPPLIQCGYLREHLHIPQQLSHIWIQTTGLNLVVPVLPKQ